jgi:hypothetical protein
VKAKHRDEAAGIAAHIDSEGESGVGEGVFTDSAETFARLAIARALRSAVRHGSIVSNSKVAQIATQNANSARPTPNPAKPLKLVLPLSATIVAIIDAVQMPPDSTEAASPLHPPDVSSHSGNCPGLRRSSLCSQLRRTSFVGGSFMPRFYLGGTMAGNDRQLRVLSPGSVRVTGGHATRLPRPVVRTFAFVRSIPV